MPFCRGFNSLLTVFCDLKSHLYETNDRKKCILSVKKTCYLVVHTDMLIFSTVLKMVTSHFNVHVLLITVLVIV